MRAFHPNQKQWSMKGLSLFVVALLAQSAALAGDGHDHGILDDDEPYTAEELELDRLIHENSPETLAKCQKLQKAYQYFDPWKIKDLYLCTGFAYSNIGDDYQTALHFGYRLFKQMPHDIEIVTNIMMWEWSRYNRGLDNREGLNRVLRVAQQSLREEDNGSDPNYNLRLGIITQVISRYYDTSKKERIIRPELYKFAKTRFLMVAVHDESSKDQKMRAQLSLAQMAYWVGDKDNSRLWLEKARELNPYDTRLRSITTRLAQH